MTLLLLPFLSDFVHDRKKKRGRRDGGGDRRERDMVGGL
jgi:hypothetical protein